MPQAFLFLFDMSTDGKYHLSLAGQIDRSESRGWYGTVANSARIITAQSPIHHYTCAYMLVENTSIPAP